MLKELHIENIAVIERVDIRFTEGLNILTGETGAGKSIVIDAIGAVLGDRTNRELVRRGAEKALVSAVFDGAEAAEWLAENEIDGEDELVLQRRISADGKSSCRVCGVPVTVAQLKELSSLLVDVHGQNDGRQLMDERRHREYLDRFGVDAEALSDYRALYSRYQSLKKELLALRMDEEDKLRLRDSLSFQIGELERAELKSGEYEEATARRDLMRHSEKLTEALDNAIALLYEGEDNAVSLAQNALYYAQRAAAITPEPGEAAESLKEGIFSLTNAAELLRDLRASLDFSPEEYDRLESRLALLSRLQRKYRRNDDDELIALLEESRQRLEELDCSDEKAMRLEKERESQRKKLLAAAAALHTLREQAARALEARITEELRDLSMPSVRFAVELSAPEGEEGFDGWGCDEVRFLMSANAGEALGRISHIASGGELSRIMLAMKNVFAENDPVGTMIFDEIDTGMSGIAAQRVGEKLCAVSRGKQVMCVTHLPQIAAMADSHFVISKEEREGRTYTEVTALERDGRQRELARLHGGDNITATTLLSAEEQLQAAERYKAELT